jgi:hypothetical protein
MQIQSQNLQHSTIQLRKCIVAYSPAPIGVPCSVQLPLADRRDLIGTSQPTLGVLFFPLSTPSRKGATHTIQRFRLALSSPRKAELPLLSELGIPTPTSKSIKSIFLQRNVTQTEDDPSSFSFLYFIEFRTSFLS